MARQTTFPDLEAVSELDWARLAAFIDGEGCIDLNMPLAPTDKSGAHTCVYVYNTDPRLIAWCKSVFGGSGFRFVKKDKPRWKPSYRWYVGGNRVTYILQRCMPYLLLKKEQADIALKFRTLTPAGRSDGQGWTLTPEVEAERFQLAVKLRHLKASGRRSKFLQPQAEAVQ